jgi:hypothetical protein
VADSELEPGLYEALVTSALERRLAELVGGTVIPEVRPLAAADAGDRFSREVAAAVVRAIEAVPESDRAQLGATITQQLLELLTQLSPSVDRDADIPLVPPQVLSSILRRLPDGSPDTLEAPLTPYSTRPC